MTAAEHPALPVGHHTLHLWLHTSATALPAPSCSSGTQQHAAQPLDGHVGPRGELSPEPGRGSTAAPGRSSSPGGAWPSCPGSGPLLLGLAPPGLHRRYLPNYSYFPAAGGSRLSLPSCTASPCQPEGVGALFPFPGMSSWVSARCTRGHGTPFCEPRASQAQHGVGGSAGCCGDSGVSPAPCCRVTPGQEGADGAAHSHEELMVPLGEHPWHYECPQGCVLTRVCAHLAGEPRVPRAPRLGPEGRRGPRSPTGSHPTPCHSGFLSRGYPA